MNRMKWLKTLTFVSAALLGAAVGCGSEGDDGSEDGEAVDLSSPEGFCEASEAAGCGPESTTTCAEDIAGLGAVCADQLTSYFACGEGKEVVSCIADTIAVGFIEGCEAEGIALQTCVAGGDGDGDGDGDGGGDGDGDGDGDGGAGGAVN